MASFYHDFRERPPGRHVLKLCGAEACQSMGGYAIAAHAALDCFARHGHSAAGIIVACFGDPGVHAIREMTPIPVIGLAEASVRIAGRRKRPFSIVTVGLAWRPNTPLAGDYRALAPALVAACEGRHYAGS